MKKELWIVLGIWMLLLSPKLIYGGSLSSVTGTALIQPMQDRSGKYMMKSTGFYCLDENGALSNAPEIHYFDHYMIDGTVFDGFYYHDKDGCFQAMNPHLVLIKNLTAHKEQMIYTEETGEETLQPEDIVFSGCFMIGNLGKMTAAPQVRYLDHVQLDQIYDGYYYFNENGRLKKEAGTYYLKMKCNDRFFDGFYFFGSNGMLANQAGTTAEGFPYDETGKIINMESGSMDQLQKEIETMTDSFPGNWSVYVKNLDSEEAFTIHPEPMSSASLIKAFVMAGVYHNMEKTLKQEASQLNLEPSDPKVQAKVNELLWNMITISDNEAFNELVRLQSEHYDFNEGAEKLNIYLMEEGYENTQVLHTLQPSGTAPTGIGEYNVTSVEDCGKLLERIENGSCVDAQASEKMKNLLLNQVEVWKIPSRLPKDVICANKTGENDTDQHDIAIINGKNTNYILCVMSKGYINEGDAFYDIGEISALTYQYLDMILAQLETQ